MRLNWLDGMKGISILWIAFFHVFKTYANDRFPYPTQDGYFAAFLAACTGPKAVCFVEALLNAVVFVGFHAVAVFLVLSGFGLTYSLAKTGNPQAGWTGWYRSRLLRLFPMYWLAHVVYLVSPFQARPEQIDYRFLLSFLGDRIWPIDSIFYYFNPALWYFGLLLQLYFVFPVLFRLLQRLGVTGFLVLAAVATFGCRWWLLIGSPVDGSWVQGGFFLSRLWEFAFGMVLGWIYRRAPEAIDRRLFSASGLLAGALVYTAGLYTYGDLRSYIFSDALTGTGLFVILAHVARNAERLPALARPLFTVGMYSYGLYLLHQPYAIYFGVQLRVFTTPVFLVFAAAILCVLFLGSMAVERTVNRLTERLLG